jgi:hypothetical protein
MIKTIGNTTGKLSKCCNGFIENCKTVFSKIVNGDKSIKLPLSETIILVNKILEEKKAQEEYLKKICEQHDNIMNELNELTEILDKMKMQRADELEQFIQRSIPPLNPCVICKSILKIQICHICWTVVKLIINVFLLVEFHYV